MGWHQGPWLFGPGWWIFPIAGMFLCVIVTFLMFRYMMGRGNPGGSPDRDEIESLRKEIRELRDEIRNFKKKGA